MYAAGRLRVRVSDARSRHELLEELAHELEFLRMADPCACETTLLIHPYVLHDFIEYNDFLAICDAMLAELGFEGELQIASFHPDYQFADTESHAIENHTNRSPYPMLHLLREASVERALTQVAHPDEIYRRNIATLRALGHEGWDKLWREP